MADTVNHSTSPSTTIHTFLCKVSKTEGEAPIYTFNKLSPIVDFPDLGGTPDTVDITDLDDEVSKSLNGVQSVTNFEFLANYTKERFESLKAIYDEGGIGTYAIVFGKKGQYGVFVWEGELAVWIVGGGVNAARQMRISISATTKVEYLDSTALTGASYNVD